MPLTLIQGGEVYAPRLSGRQDVLLCLGRILKIGDIDGRALKTTGLEVESVDATGCIVTPGFIDPHEHLLGGSGEDGFATQTPQIARCSVEYKYPIEQMIRFVTSNTADALKLKDKARLREGNTADVLVIKADSFELQDVFCNGTRLFKNGQLNFRERFLKGSNRHVKLDGEKPPTSSNGKPGSDPEENKGKFRHGIEQVNTGNGSIQGIININGGKGAGGANGQNKYLECNTPVDARKQNNKPDDRHE